MQPILRLAAIACLAVAPAPAAEPTITGPAEVLDGDTLRIRGTTVRLKGISAPEIEQAGGRQASDALQSIIAGRPVRCELTGEKTRGREVGYCSAGGQDLQSELVRRGFAMACPRYSARYVHLEADPRAQRSGVWANGYVLPNYCKAR